MTVPAPARRRRPPPSRPRRLAVFDIDGTIFRSSLLIECVEALIAAGVFSERARAVYAAAHRRWLDRRGAYEKYIDAVVTAFRRHIVGVAEADFLPVVRRMLRGHRGRVYRYTRDLVASLRRRGYFLLAVSQSPKYLVDGFARELGFHRIYGRVLELDGRGRFTGGALHLDVIDHKAKVVRRALEREGLTLAGTQEGQVVTDSSGFYVFSGLPPGSYAIRPSDGGCAFSPDVANFNDLGGDVVQDIIVMGCPGW